MDEEARSRSVPEWDISSAIRLRRFEIRAIQILLKSRTAISTRDEMANARFRLARILETNSFAFVSSLWVICRFSSFRASKVFRSLPFTCLSAAE